MSRLKYEYYVTDDPIYPFHCNAGGYVFREERQAQNFCQMWNDHWEAMEKLNGIPSELTREQYVEACTELGVFPMSDRDCDSYGVRYGEFTPWLDKDGNIAGYTPAQALQMALAYRRLKAIEAERKARPKKVRQLDYPDGRELDCGCIVFWQNEVMRASLGSSCADCYDRMSD